MSAAVDLATRPDGRAARAGAYGLAAGAALAAVLALAAWMALGTVLNHDSAWYLVATRRMLDGARLYVDLVEVNPPLAFYLTVPPVWAAGVTGLSAIDLFFLWVYGLTGLGVLLVAAVLRGAPGLSDGLRRALVAAALVSLLFATWRQIGQREHLMMIFTMPYLFLAGVRAAGGSCGRGLATATGAFAAFGLALKPYFLLVPAAVELYLVARGRKAHGLFRPETLALGVLLAAYAAIVAVVTPEYLTRIVPWGSRAYYAYGNDPAAVLLQGETFLVALALALGLLARRSSRLRPWIDVFLVAAAAFFAVYVMQFKGWTYHRMPAGWAAMMALALCAMGGERMALATGVRVVAAALLVLTAEWLFLAGSYRNVFFERALPVVRAAGPGDSLYALSTNVWQAFPLANYAGLEWRSRFPTLWLLPGVRRTLATGREAPAAERAALHGIESYVREAVIADLERGRPSFVILDVRPDKSYFAADFDYLAYLGRDARFARLWARYEPFAELYGFRFYRLRPEQADGGARP